MVSDVAFVDVRARHEKGSHDGHDERTASTDDRDEYQFLKLDPACPAWSGAVVPVVWPFVTSVRRGGWRGPASLVVAYGVMIAVTVVR